MDFMSAPKAARERYAEYLNSPHWEQLRLLSLHAAGHKCECCEFDKDLTVHHIHYRDLYNCTVDDVMCLCWRCHKWAHRAFKWARQNPDSLDRSKTIRLIKAAIPRSAIPQRIVTKLESKQQAALKVISDFQANKFSSHSLNQLIASLQLLSNTP